MNDIIKFKRHEFTDSIHWHHFRLLFKSLYNYRLVGDYIVADVAGRQEVAALFGRNDDGRLFINEIAYREYRTPRDIREALGYDIDAQNGDFLRIGRRYRVQGDLVIEVWPLDFDTFVALYRAEIERGIEGLIMDLADKISRVLCHRQDGKFVLYVHSQSQARLICRAFQAIFGDAAVRVARWDYKRHDIADLATSDFENELITVRTDYSRSPIYRVEFAPQPHVYARFFQLILPQLKHVFDNMALPEGHYDQEINVDNHRILLHANAPAAPFNAPPLNQRLVLGVKISPSNFPLPQQMLTCENYIQSVVDKDDVFVRAIIRPQTIRIVHTQHGENRYHITEPCLIVIRTLNRAPSHFQHRNLATIHANNDFLNRARTKVRRLLRQKFGVDEPTIVMRNDDHLVARVLLPRHYRDYYPKLANIPVLSLAELQNSAKDIAILYNENEYLLIVKIRDIPIPPELR